MRRNPNPLLRWLWTLRVRSVLALMLIAFTVLRFGVPYLLRGHDAMAPIAAMSAAAAPLVCLILAVALPAALWRACRERRLVRKLRSIDALRAMDWQDLEVLVRRLFEQKGYRATRLGGDGADGGVDVVLRREGRLILVQCKQWKTRQVGVGPVRELLGVVALYGADGGMVVTCGVFTKEARAFAQQAGIELIDGQRLLQLAERDAPAPAVRTLGGGRSKRPAAEDLVGCPSCGGQMVRRLAKTGQHAGQEFLGCARYPGCKGTRNL
jgi:restriction system protein